MGVVIADKIKLKKTCKVVVKLHASCTLTIDVWQMIDISQKIINVTTLEGMK